MFAEEVSVQQEVAAQQEAAKGRRIERYRARKQTMTSDQREHDHVANIAPLKLYKDVNKVELQI